MVYRDPKEGSESFIERFCLRKRKQDRYADKKIMVDDANRLWREKYKKDSVALREYLRLQEGENPFER